MTGGLERSQQAENVRLPARAPDSIRESGFLFEGLRSSIEAEKQMGLYDKFGRQITDLRISVTDRCNIAVRVLPFR